MFAESVRSGINFSITFRTPPFTVAGCLPSHTTLVHCRMLRIWTHHQAAGHWHNEMMSNYSPLRDGPVMKPLDPRKDSTAHQGHLDVISPLHPSTGPDWPGHRLGSCRVGCGISSACPPGPFRPARSRTAVHTAQCKAAVKNDSRFYAPTSSKDRDPSLALLCGGLARQCEREMRRSPADLQGVVANLNTHGGKTEARPEIVRIALLDPQRSDGPRHRQRRGGNPPVAASPAAALPHPPLAAFLLRPSPRRLLPVDPSSSPVAASGDSAAARVTCPRKIQDGQGWALLVSAAMIMIPYALKQQLRLDCEPAGGNLFAYASIMPPNAPSDMHEYI